MADWDAITKYGGDGSRRDGLKKAIVGLECSSHADSCALWRGHLGVVVTSSPRDEWHANCTTNHRMLRITVLESSESAAVLRVEGRIAGSHVAELRRACDAHTPPEKVRLSLQLGDVSFADSAGIELLKELRSRGVGLTRTTPFVAELLKDGESFDATDGRQ